MFKYSIINKCSWCLKYEKKKQNKITATYYKNNNLFPYFLAIGTWARYCLNFQIVYNFHFSLFHCKTIYNYTPNRFDIKRIWSSMVPFALVCYNAMQTYTQLICSFHSWHSFFLSINASSIFPFHFFCSLACCSRFMFCLFSLSVSFLNTYNQKNQVCSSLTMYLPSKIKCTIEIARNNKIS